MKKTYERVRLLICAGSALCHMASLASAQSMITTLGGAAGLQNAATGVNNSGQAIGVATAANSTGPELAWVGSATQPQTLLPALVSGKSCDVSMISNNNIILGSCVDANDRGQAVRWTWTPATGAIAGPTVLQPIGGQLYSSGTAMNQAGWVIGVSATANGTTQPALWSPTSSTPIQLTLAQGCSPVDLSETTAFINSEPIVIMDCPNTSGTGTANDMTAELVEATGLLNAYQVVKWFALPTGAEACDVTGFVETNSTTIAAGGTCVFGGSTQPQAAYWSNVTTGAAPTLLAVTGLPAGTRNAGIAINNSGHMLFTYQQTSGIDNIGYWNPVTNQQILYTNSLSGFHQGAVSLGDNDAVCMNVELSTQTDEALTWTPLIGAGGTQKAKGFLFSGSTSGFSDCSQDGTVGVGGAQGSGGNANAFITSVP